jgi:uncharacterized RDD family membrane protein YckC
MNPMKESLHFYARHIESLLVLSAVIVLPFMIVHNLTINYINFLTMITGAKAVASFFNLFLLLLFLTVAQVPFAQFVRSEQEGEERPLLRAVRAFAEHGFPVFLFGIVYVLAVSVGMVLFVVPGLILMILFYLTPYLVVMKQNSPWQCLRGALEMGKRHFVQIFGLMLSVSFPSLLSRQASVPCFSPNCCSMSFYFLLSRSCSPCTPKNGAQKPCGPLRMWH